MVPLEEAANETVLNEMLYVLVVPVAVTEIPRTASVELAAGAFKLPIKLLYTFAVADAVVPERTIPLTPGVVVNAPEVVKS